MHMQSPISINLNLLNDHAHRFIEMPPFPTRGIFLVADLKKGGKGHVCEGVRAAAGAADAPELCMDALSSASPGCPPQPLQGLDYIMIWIKETRI